MQLYTAEFKSGAVSRAYGKPLTYATRLEYRPANDENAKPAVKFVFSQSKEAADKVAKLPKRLTLISAETVVAKDTGPAPSKAKAAPKPKTKAEKPFAKGDKVTIMLAGQTVAGQVMRVGTKYAYVAVDGALNDIKVAFASVTKVTVATHSPANAELVTA